MELLRYKRIQGLIVLALACVLDWYAGSPMDEDSYNALAQQIAGVGEAVGIGWNVIGQMLARGPIRLRSDHLLPALLVGLLLPAGCSIRNTSIEYFRPDGSLEKVEKVDDRRLVMIAPEATQALGVDGQHAQVGVPLPGGASIGLSWSNGTFVRANQDADFSAQGGISLDAQGNIIGIERQVGANQLADDCEEPETKTALEQLQGGFVTDSLGTATGLRIE